MQKKERKEKHSSKHATEKMIQKWQKSHKMIKSDKIRHQKLASKSKIKWQHVIKRITIMAKSGINWTNKHQKATKMTKKWEKCQKMAESSYMESNKMQQKWQIIQLKLNKETKKQQSNDKKGTKTPFFQTVSIRAIDMFL